MLQHFIIMFVYLEEIRYYNKPICFISTIEIGKILIKNVYVNL